MASIRHQKHLLSSTQRVSLDPPKPKWAKEGGNVQENDVCVCQGSTFWGLCVRARVYSHGRNKFTSATFGIETSPVRSTPPMN